MSRCKTGLTIEKQHRASGRHRRRSLSYPNPIGALFDVNRMSGRSGTCDPARKYHVSDEPPEADEVPEHGADDETDDAPSKPADTVERTPNGIEATALSVGRSKSNGSA